MTIDQSAFPVSDAVAGKCGLGHSVDALSAASIKAAIDEFAASHAGFVIDADWSIRFETWEA
jgi:hypothetical protein